MARTHYYVSPASGNDTTGNGSIGTPWATTQHALNTITRNATDGDQVNVQAGAADVLAAPLSIATYGTPTAAAPLLFRGYTSTANDGGIGEISGNATYSIWTTSNTDYVHFIDLKMGNCGANVVMSGLRNYCLLFRCEVYGNTGTNGVLLSGTTRVVGCHLHDLAGNYALYSSQPSIIVGCYIDTGSVTPTAAVVLLDGVAAVLAHNVIRLRSGNIDGVRGAGALALHNTIVSDGASTGTGLFLKVNSLNLNNIVQGFSGNSGKGGSTVDKNVMLLLANAAYNNATNYSLTLEMIVESINNDTLAGAPFVDAANGDFDINGTVAGVTEDAWPSAFLGLASTSSKADKGAAQAGAGGGPVIGSRIIQGWGAV